MAKDPNDVATICQTCDGKNKKAEAKLSLTSYDIHRRPGGDHSVTYDGKVWGFKPALTGQRLSFFKSFPPPPDAGYPFVPVKYRQGAFWFLGKGGQTLYKWDPQNPAWKPILVLKQPFQAFEVGFNDEILMITGDGEGKNRLIEVYDPFSVKPIAVEEFPETGLKPLEASYVPAYWAAPVTTTIDEFSVIYLPMCGRMFSYNIAKHSLREVSVPWPKLDSKMIQAEYDTYGAINLSQFPALCCLQFLPTEGLGLRVAHQLPAGSKVKRVLVNGAAEWVSAEKAPPRGPILIGELNLLEGTYRKLDTAEDVWLPVWPGPKSTWVPLSKMCAVPNSPAAPTARKPKTKS